MSDKDALQGLACPRCGGMVPIPEGQAIVACPFCELRSQVAGERGLRRYQVPARISREQAQAALQKFLRSSAAIAGSAAREAQLSEVTLVHLPFWAAWGKVLGWVFGEKAVGSGDSRRLEPREMRVMEEMSWNGAACDVGEFGVTAISLQGRSLEAFTPDALHRSGLVFEPVGSPDEAWRSASADFEQRVSQQAGLNRVAQRFIRVLRPRLGVVYYPLWVLRYLYRGRSFQVAVDGFSGEVLYGKAPGNVLYRAAALVGGMAAGAFTAIDIPGFILANGGGEDEGMGIVAVAFVIGLGIMYWAWHTFRHAEHYEYRRYAAAAALSMRQSAQKFLQGE